VFSKLCGRVVLVGLSLIGLQMYAQCVIYTRRPALTFIYTPAALDAVALQQISKFNILVKNRCKFVKVVSVSNREQLDSAIKYSQGDVVIFGHRTHSEIDISRNELVDKTIKIDQNLGFFSTATFTNPHPPPNRLFVPMQITTLWPRNVKRIALAGCGTIEEPSFAAPSAVTWGYPGKMIMGPVLETLYASVYAAWAADDEHFGVVNEFAGTWNAFVTGQAGIRYNQRIVNGRIQEKLIRKEWVHQ